MRIAVPQLSGASWVSISDVDGLLLRSPDDAIELTERLTACSQDRRLPERIEHALTTTSACLRVFGLAVGEEGLNDHDDHPRDPIVRIAGRQKCPKGHRRGVAVLNRMSMVGLVTMASRKIVTVSITPEQNAFVRERVDSGRFGSVSEVVRAGLRLLEHSEAAGERKIRRSRSSPLAAEE